MIAIPSDGLALRRGPWVLGAVLGRGGMGEVRVGHDPRTGRRAAVKIVTLPQPNLRAALRREIHALASVDHPGIVRVLDAGPDDAEPWVALELVEGRPLHEHLAPGSAGSGSTFIDDEDGLVLVGGGSGGLPALTALRQVAVALAHLHAAGVVHGDLKPENVLVTPEGRAVLVDFGLAAHRGHRVDVDAVGTAGRVAGTAAWIAPEVVAREPFDGRADLYALGCLLFWACSGRAPFEGSPQHVLAAHQHDAAPRLADVGAVVPPDLEALVASLLEKDPRRRPARANRVVRVLTALGVPGEGDLPRRAPLFEAVPQRLDGVLDRVAAARRAVVCGEAGLGRSTALREIARRARRRREAVLATRGADGPLATVRPWFDALGLRAVGDGPDALAAALASGLRGRCWLLVDDLDRADPASRAVIERLAVHRPEANVIGSALEPLPGFEAVALGRLGEDDLRGVVRDVLGDEALDTAYVNHVVASSGGNPGVASSLLAADVESGALRLDEDGVWRRQPGAPLPVFQPLADTVATRVAGLSGLGRNALVGLAALESAEEGLVEAACGAEGPAALTELAARGLVVAEAGGWRVPHLGPVRAALDEVAPPELHRRALAWLEARGADATVLARHCEGAGDTDRAAALWAQAGRAAASVGALAAAEADLARAAALAADPGRLRVERADVLSKLGRNPEAEAELRAVAAGGGGAGRVATVDLVRLLVSLGRVDEALDTLGTLGEDVDGDVARWRAELEAELAAEAGRHEDAAIAVEGLLEHAPAAERPRLFGLLGRLAFRMSRPEASERWFGLAGEAALAVGDRVAAALADHNRATAVRRLGRRDEAREAYDRALVLYRRLGLRRHEAALLGSLGILRLEAGDDAAAEEALLQALTIYRVIGDQGGAARVMISRADLRWSRGDYAAAMTTALEARALAPTDALVRCTSQMMHALSAAWAGDPGAPGFVAEALADAQRLGFPADVRELAIVQARLAEDDGRLDDALAALELEDPPAPRLRLARGVLRDAIGHPGADADLTEAAAGLVDGPAASVRLHLARRAGAAGDWDAALEAFEAPLPPTVARRPQNRILHLVEHGRVLLGAGRDPSPLLDEARARVLQAGMRERTRVARAVERLEAAARGEAVTWPALDIVFF